MSQKLYDSMLDKWKDFLGTDDVSYYLSAIGDRDSAIEVYEGISHDFCIKYRYKEKTEEIAFHENWVDTFMDEFYQMLEREGIDLDELDRLKESKEDE